MGYSENDGMVRVDRFKPGGKWYDTWEVDMSTYWNQGVGFVEGLTLGEVHFAVRLAILNRMRADNEAAVTAWVRQEGNPNRWPTEDPYRTSEQLRASFLEWTWVCLEPYHKNAHPIMLVARKGNS